MTTTDKISCYHVDGIVKSRGRAFLNSLSISFDALEKGVNSPISNGISNFIHLELDAMDIANLLNYLRHIQSESKKEYVPITGEGLTEEQLAEELKKGEEDIKAGRYYTADEVFEQLRKEIEDGDS